VGDRGNEVVFEAVKFLQAPVGAEQFLGGGF
jgi:hypothetical protein